MATTFDQPHVQPELLLHMFKNTSQLQCVIPNSPLEASPSTTSVISMDVRNEPVAPPPSPMDPNQSNIDHITSLEHSLCSDFLCCGARLPDLHALLEHFEEDHIMVLAPNGKRVYPADGLRAVPLHPLCTSSCTTPSSSRSSSVLSSPNSTSCPLSPSSPGLSSASDLPSRLHGTFERRKSSIVVAPVYTPFTPNLPIDPAYPYQDSTEIDIPLYDFSQDFYPSYSVQLPASHFDDDDDEGISDACASTPTTSPIPTSVYGPDNCHSIAQIPKSSRGSTLDGLKTVTSSSKSSKVKHRQLHLGNISNSRRREKAYRCPTPRCTKSYLNPNGLKYHLEKGTCKIESEYEYEAGEESNVLPTQSSLVQPQHPTSLNAGSLGHAVADVGNHGHQQPGTQRHHEQESFDESGLNHPHLFRQYHHQQHQYPDQYPSARPLFPGQVQTPIAVSSHHQ